MFLKKVCAQFISCSQFYISINIFLFHYIKLRKYFSLHHVAPSNTRVCNLKYRAVRKVYPTRGTASDHRHAKGEAQITHQGFDRASFDPGHK